MRPNPLIYEINTAVWLSELTRAYGHSVHLGNVPSTDWDTIASWGFDAVWLMGVWERSAAGRQIARQHPDLQAEYHRALPDYAASDVIGSPYAVHRYVADTGLGGPEALKVAREELARRGIALLLDFVPNHVSIDHPWTQEHPEYFIHDENGTIANGRDPYFPPWTDTAQVNVFNSSARSALMGTLRGISAECDGIRCDMAMLLLNDVFEKTWGLRAGARPASEFWDEAIPAIKSEFPHFLFIAEVYWELEFRMQQVGFDYCYDKRLYDRLLHENAGSLREHLTGGLEYQRKLLRFIENHDEPRAAAVFTPEKEKAAAVVTSTLPGATLFHQGQFEGNQIKLPVQLTRRPEEPVNSELRDFYQRLLQACRDPLFRDGDWQLLDATGWPDNSSYTNLLAWCWSGAQKARAIIIVNYSETRSQGLIRLPWQDLAGVSWRLIGVAGSGSYIREGNDLLAFGLFVDLPAWGFHFFIISYDVT